MFTLFVDVSYCIATVYALLCGDHLILSDDILVSICPTDKCLGVLVIRKPVLFPDSSPRSHGSYTFSILNMVDTFAYITCYIFPLP